MSSPPSYLILGAGVFGVSTALHLAQAHPSARITLLDRDAHDAATRCAASWDWNKVVRADYDDVAYCRLALEAQDVFETDPLWRPFFHQTGIYWLCRSDYARDVIANYGKLGRKADLSAVEVGEARTLYGGVFGDADERGVKEVLVNRTSGWAEAGRCLGAITQRCLELGVQYEVGEAETLVVDAGGRCTGIRVADGRVFSADKIVLSTGAYTGKLLEVSALRCGRPNLSAGQRIVAGGIATGMTTLGEADFDTYKDMPVGVQGYTPETGPFIGSLPPTKDRELKWWGQLIFRNTEQVVPGHYISTPPKGAEYSQWDVGRGLKKDIEHARDVFYGKKSEHWKMEKHRICWDAFTASGDFIISKHSGAEGLYVATCGNFHGWKFFPVIGKYVAQMLDGSLEPELEAKWAWDREWPASALFADYPRWEMKEVERTEQQYKL